MRDLLSRHGASTRRDCVTRGINHLRIESAFEVVTSRVQLTEDRDGPPGVKRRIGIHHQADELDKEIANGWGRLPDAMTGYRPQRAPWRRLPELPRCHPFRPHCHPFRLGGCG